MAAELVDASSSASSPATGSDSEASAPCGPQPPGTREPFALESRRVSFEAGPQPAPGVPGLLHELRRCCTALLPTPAPRLRSTQTVLRIPDEECVDDSRPSMDLTGLAGGTKGTGPRLFCGHVPKVGCRLLLCIVALLAS